jgi:hypothetical protein
MGMSCPEGAQAASCLLLTAPPTAGGAASASGGSSNGLARSINSGSSCDYIHAIAGTPAVRRDPAGECVRYR